MREKQNIIAISKFVLFLFESTLALQTPSEKITVTGDGSNNSEVWGLGAEPLTLQRFSIFFQKIKHFCA